MPKIIETVTEYKKFIEGLKFMGIPIPEKTPLNKLSSILGNYLKSPSNNSSRKKRSRKRGKHMSGPRNSSISNMYNHVQPTFTNGAYGGGQVIQGYMSVSHAMTVGNAPDIGFGPGFRIKTTGIAGTVLASGAGNLVIADAGSNTRANYDLPFNPSRPNSITSPMTTVAPAFERYWVREVKYSFIPAFNNSAAPGIISMAIVEMDVTAPLTYNQTIGTAGAVVFTNTISATCMQRCGCQGPPLFMGTGGVAVNTETEQFYLSVRSLQEAGLTIGTVYGQIMIEVTVDMWGITAKPVTPPTVQLENRIVDSVIKRLNDPNDLSARIQIVEDKDEKFEKPSSKSVSLTSPLLRR